MILLHMKRLTRCSFLMLMVLAVACSGDRETGPQPVHKDVAFPQVHSVKWNLDLENVALKNVYTDRNGVIQLYSSAGLLKPFAGEFLYPGTLVPEKTYRPIADKKIMNLGLYNDQFVYIDDKAVLSNAWAGTLYSRYTMPNANMLEGGKDFSFLISDGVALQYLKDSKVIWEGKNNEQIIDFLFDDNRNLFWILGKNSISVFDVEGKALSQVFSGSELTCFTLSKNNELIVGTNDGYFIIDGNTKQQKGELVKKLPWTEITAVNEVDGKLWFGSTKGAFMLDANGKYRYYASKRWLPSDSVTFIGQGPDKSVLIVTNKGLSNIVSTNMTLYDKAMYYEKQVRSRHIRHGFNATLGYMTDGSLATGSLEDSDNDGLWTTMYLAAEVFRYEVTKSDEALQNIRECMEAMERLYTINGVKGGFPSRSFERRGYKFEDKPWRRANDPEWDWKSTTSSDEAIGHIFAFATMAELLDDQKDLQNRAVVLIDSLMQHTIDNNYYLIDWNGEPTLWGKWNPDYVNARPVGVGDRKINSSNYIAMLQTAYHFTKKEVYKEKAFELMTKYGYYENLMFPMSQVRKADDSADDWSKMLSESWNHSDDEMYFVGYWGLYRYAFNDTLRTRFKESILDHWQIERPEKEGAWNIFTALTGTPEFDLTEAIWYLQEYPLDLIHWRVTNSSRKDIEMLEPNFRKQTTKEVLPAGELPISRHNANRFSLDGGDNGTSEYSAGDIWLLPYWMGRYLNVISEPQ